MWGAITNLLGGIAKPISEYYTRKRELKAEEHHAALEILKAQAERQAELIKQGLTADMNWEMEFAQQARSSWKDEYVLAVVSVPAVLCFWPGYADVVAAGFSALDKTPTYYQIILGSMFLSTIGVRWWRRTQSDT